MHLNLWNSGVLLDKVRFEHNISKGALQTRMMGREEMDSL